jgi:hypothetical protein
LDVTVSFGSFRFCVLDPAKCHRWRRFKYGLRSQSRDASLELLGEPIFGSTGFKAQFDLGGGEGG